MEEQEIRQVAQEIRGWIEDAVGDVAATYRDAGFFGNEKMEKTVKKLKKECSDWVGALADHLYNDVDTLSDLTGDRIYDGCRGRYQDMILVAEEMKSTSHSNLNKALDQHIERWREAAQREAEHEAERAERRRKR